MFENILSFVGAIWLIAFILLVIGLPICFLRLLLVAIATESKKPRKESFPTFKRWLRMR